MSSFDFKPEDHYVAGISFMCWFRVSSLLDPLDLLDLVSFAQTCRTFHEIANLDSLWATIERATRPLVRHYNNFSERHKPEFRRLISPFLPIHFTFTGRRAEHLLAAVGGSYVTSSFLSLVAKDIKEQVARDAATKSAREVPLMAPEKDTRTGFQVAIETMSSTLRKHRSVLARLLTSPADALLSSTKERLVGEFENELRAIIFLPSTGYALGLEYNGRSSSSCSSAPHPAAALPSCADSMRWRFSVAPRGCLMHRAAEKLQRLMMRTIDDDRVVLKPSQLGNRTTLTKVGWCCVALVQIFFFALAGYFAFWLCRSHFVSAGMVDVNVDIIHKGDTTSIWTLLAVLFSRVWNGSTPFATWSSTNSVLLYDRDTKTPKFFLIGLVAVSVAVAVWCAVDLLIRETRPAVRTVAASMMLLRGAQPPVPPEKGSGDKKKQHQTPIERASQWLMVFDLLATFAATILDSILTHVYALLLATFCLVVPAVIAPNFCRLFLPSGRVFNNPKNFLCHGLGSEWFPFVSVGNDGWQETARQFVRFGMHKLVSGITPVDAVICSTFWVIWKSAVPFLSSMPGGIFEHYNSSSEGREDGKLAPHPLIILLHACNLSLLHSMTVLALNTELFGANGGMSWWLALVGVLMVRSIFNFIVFRG